MLFFIPGSVPSSKNSKVWTGRFLVVSKATKKYIKATEAHWKGKAVLFKKKLAKKQKPYKIGFHFVRGSKHQYDFVNPVQTVQDLMVTYGWLEDDNVDIMLPFPLEYPEKSSQFSSYNKTEPGVYIEIL